VQTAERLERLRSARCLQWGELLEELQISRSMKQALFKGQRGASPKLLRRIEAAERAAGLVPAAPVTHVEKPGSSDMAARSGMSLASLRADVAEMKARMLAEFERLESRLDEMERRG